MKVHFEIKFPTHVIQNNSTLNASRPVPAVPGFRIQMLTMYYSKPGSAFKLQASNFKGDVNNCELAPGMITMLITDILSVRLKFPGSGHLHHLRRQYGNDFCPSCLSLWSKYLQSCISHNFASHFDRFVSLQHMSPQYRRNVRPRCHHPRRSSLGRRRDSHHSRSTASNGV